MNQQKLHLTKVLPHLSNLKLVTFIVIKKLNITEIVN